MSFAFYDKVPVPVNPAPPDSSRIERSHQQRSALRGRAFHDAPKGQDTSNDGYPAGYFNLKIGTQYIVLGGNAVPITGLAGRTIGGCFYPNNGHTGHQIKERTATQREQYAAAKLEPAPRPVVSGFDPSDWK